MKSILALFLLVGQTVLCQEKFTLDYQFGRASVPNDQSSDFLKFLKKFKKQEIDSIQFVGSSDSAGLFLSNFRMTELRSRKIRNACASTLSENIPYRILPTYNKGAGELRNIRAVEVIVYAHEKTKKITFNETADFESPCYRVAYSALQSCHLRYEKKGRKSYVYLERYFPFASSEQEQLYSGTINEAGEFEYKPLKWKLEKTGSQEWKGEHFVTKIPEEDFDKFKIFTLENGPCTTCHDDFAANKQIKDNQPINLPDYVVMDEIQYRQPWLMKKKVQVRIPKEFVDDDLDYVSNRSAVNWKENAKHPDYFYATVSQSDGQVDLIYRPYRMPNADECKSQSPFAYSDPEVICGPKKARSEVINFVEFGMHNQNSTNYPYAAIGVFSGTKAVEIEFLAGIHQKAAFFGAIRGRLNIVNTPFSAFLPANTWRHSIEKNRFWFARLYVGAEYKASLGKRSENYLEPNLNIGLSIAQNGNPTFQRFFVQYGKGVNFALESPYSSYSIFQFGFQAHLGKKEYLKERGTL